MMRQKTAGKLHEGVIKQMHGGEVSAKTKDGAKSVEKIVYVIPEPTPTPPKPKKD